MDIVTEGNKMLLEHKKITIPRVVPLLRAYYAKGNWAGGSLHIVLDDGNTDKGFLPGCVAHAQENKDEDGEVLAKLLLEMSQAQIDKLYQMEWPLDDIYPQEGVQ